MFQVHSRMFNLYLARNRNRSLIDIRKPDEQRSQERGEGRERVRTTLAAMSTLGTWWTLWTAADVRRTDGSNIKAQGERSAALG